MERETERARAALEAVDGYWHWQLDVGAAWYSDGYARLLGLDPGALRSHVSEREDRIHPDDRLRVFEAMAAHLAGNAPVFEATFRMRTRTGDYRWLRDRARVTARDAAGRALRLDGVVVAVDTEVAAAAERAAAARLAERILEGAVATALLAVDASGTILFANRGVTSLLGYEPASLVGKVGFESLLAPESVAAAGQIPPAPAVREGRAFDAIRAQVGRNPAGREVVYALGADGRRLAMGLHIQPSTAGGFVITLEPAAEAPATVSSFRDRLARLAEPALVVAEGGNILLANAPLCEAIDYPEAELTRLSLRALLHPDDAADLTAAMTRSAAGPVGGIVRLRRRSREWGWFDLQLSDGRADPHVGGYLLVLRDVTARKQRVAAIEADAERFRLGAKLAQIGLWDWNIVTGELYWSEQIGPLFGFGANLPETTYENFLACVHPDDRSLVTVAVDRAVYGREPYNIDHRVVWPDGTVRWMNERGDVVYAADGTPIRMLGVVIDVTELRAADAAVREREERIRALLENSFEGVMAIGADNQVVFVSNGALRIYGLKADQMTETAVTERIHPDDRPDVLAMWQTLLAEPGSRTRMISRIARDDGWRSVEFAISNLLHVPAVGAVVINMRDVTHSLRVEAQLRESETRTRAIFNSVSDAVLTIDRQGVIVDANTAAGRLLGIDAAELPGLAMRSFLAADDLARLAPLVRALSDVDGSPASVAGIVDVIKAGGARASAEVEVSLVRLRGEWMFTAIFRDLTERRKAESLQRRLLGILEAAPDLICMADEAGRVAYVNPAGRRMLGLEEGALPDSLEAVHVQGERARIREEAVAKAKAGGVWTGESVLLGAAGPLPVAESIVAHRGPRGDGLVLATICRDISDEKRVQRMKDELISTVNHELRTPLTSIRGTLGLLLGGVAEDPAEAHELLQVAVRNTDRLARLINDFLDLAKLEAGERLVTPRDSDLVQLVGQATDVMRGFAAEAGVPIRWAPPAEGVPAYVDPERFVQVMSNLLSNAVKFTMAGTSVDVEIIALGRWVRVAVADRGPGIPESFRHRIFQKFAQADASDRRRSQGSGLGLSISKNLVVAMGGCLAFRAREGGGTVFEVDIPAGPRPPQA